MTSDDEFPEDVFSDGDDERPNTANGDGSGGVLLFGERDPAADAEHAVADAPDDGQPVARRRVPLPLHLQQQQLQYQQQPLAAAAAASMGGGGGGGGGGGAVGSTCGTTGIGAVASAAGAQDAWGFLPLGHQGQRPQTPGI